MQISLICFHIYKWPRYYQLLTTYLDANYKYWSAYMVTFYTSKEWKHKVKKVLHYKLMMDSQQHHKKISICYWSLPRYALMQNSPWFWIIVINSKKKFNAHFRHVKKDGWNLITMLKQTKKKYSSKIIKGWKWKKNVIMHRKLDII